MASKNNSVKNAVWIGASLLAYGEYIYLKSNNLRISSNSFWIKQSELLRFSQEFSKNTIQNARVNQWYSGDHSNSSYNYLRSNGILRRVTAVGEFNLNKELPIDLSLNDLCQYEYKGISIKITISDLIQWIKDVYSKYIFAEKGKTSKPTERELPQSEVTDNNDNKKIEESMIIVRQPQSTGSNKNLDICQYIHQFMGAVKNNEVEVYNEFSLQHELGIYLRSILDKKYKIQFERNVSYFNIQKENMLKKEMDIAIFNEDNSEKYCIELKFPSNGQYPEQMFSICKDIKFLEQLIDTGFSGCYSVNYVADKVFYKEYDNETGIYEIFRKNKKIEGVITKPTGKKDVEYKLNGSYDIKWNSIDNIKKYFIVEIM